MADGVDLQVVNDVYRDCIEAGRGLTQDMINWRRVIQNDGQLGNAAAANTVSEIQIGNAEAVRAAIGFAAASVTEMRKYGIAGGRGMSASDDYFTALQGGIGNDGITDIPANPPVSGNKRWGGLRFGGQHAGLIMLTGSYDVYLNTWGYNTTYQGWRVLLDKRNTTTDPNGFIKAASPIFRLANTAADAMNDGYTDGEAGVANNEATGVTATHDDVGVYTVTGSLGFATEGWSFELPQDDNRNVLCFLETEQAEDGTITVRVFSRKFDINTASVVAGDPMDIPAGRFVSLRLSMPEVEDPAAQQAASETTEQEPTE